MLHVYSAIFFFFFFLVLRIPFRSRALYTQPSDSLISSRSQLYSPRNRAFIHIAFSQGSILQVSHVWLSHKVKQRKGKKKEQKRSSETGIRSTTLHHPYSVRHIRPHTGHDTGITRNTTITMITPISPYKVSTPASIPTGNRWD